MVPSALRNFWIVCVFLLWGVQGGLPPTVVAQFGCAAGCVYKPANVVQLQACASAARLGGASVYNQFDCAQYTDPDECKGNQSRNGEPCKWLPTSEAWKEKLGPGGCLPERLYTPEWQSSTGMDIFYNDLKEYNVPNTVNMNKCLEHSYTNQTTCEAAFDGDGRQCGWCEGIPDYYFLNPDFKTMCIQADLLKGACDMLKRDDVPGLCKGKTTPTPSMTTSQSSGESTESPDSSTRGTRFVYTLRPSSASSSIYPISFLSFIPAVYSLSLFHL